MENNKTQIAGEKRASLTQWLSNNKHAWLALYVPAYLGVFCLLQNRNIPDYFVSYMPVDDLIPFCEYFAVFYCMWYFLLLFSGLFLLIKDPHGFKCFMAFMMIGYTICLVTYAVFPFGQNLRPEAFARDNVFSRTMGLLYSLDPNINVLPSMHVVGSAMSASAIAMSPAVKRSRVKVGVCVLSALIAISTVFVKQHSVLDMIAAIAICIPIFFIVYAPYTRSRREKMNGALIKRWRLSAAIGAIACAACVAVMLQNLP